MKYHKHRYWSDDGSGDTAVLMLPVYAEAPARVLTIGIAGDTIQFDLDTDDSPEECDEDGDPLN